MNRYMSVILPKYGSAFGGQQDMMIKQNNNTNMMPLTYTYRQLQIVRTVQHINR
jgi:hypothetical protein